MKIENLSSAGNPKIKIYLNIVGVRTRYPSRDGKRL